MNIRKRVTLDRILIVGLIETLLGKGLISIDDLVATERSSRSVISAIKNVKDPDTQAYADELVTELVTFFAAFQGNRSRRDSH